MVLLLCPHTMLLVCYLLLNIASWFEQESDILGFNLVTTLISISYQHLSRFGEFLYINMMTTAHNLNIIKIRMTRSAVTKITNNVYQPVKPKCNLFTQSQRTCVHVKL